MKLEKTRGIVLGYVRYSETSIVVRIYTDMFGTQAYIVNGVRSAKLKTNKIALYQPLTVLDLVVYQSEKTDSLQRISEARCPVVWANISTNFLKTTIALFLAEVLDLVLQQEAPNPELFDFLVNSLRVFDLQTHEIENFHLRFLLKLTRFLGFAPSSADDIYNLIYKAEFQSWRTIIPAQEQAILAHLIHSQYTDELLINNHIRRHLLDQILLFYENNLQNWRKLRSIEVLRSL
ncbi:DNA repair protein RecO (recombination protein O) [Flexibacter flexilis DSM 6793]|uniref:DNA repair protein RecO n=1 Tax=Flexibacter flexilis DSM 6793 TaxID=927664 RepID=A0A1I1DVW7_9BACT|nr:DNA repair protein RecO [Flexibacter flexilis]SFB79075.1 DNA repair protein RecO (recombination protein O) [Flexibacter flexilis DSM 6793]